MTRMSPMLRRRPLLTRTSIDALSEADNQDRTEDVYERRATPKERRRGPSLRRGAIDTPFQLATRNSEETAECTPMHLLGLPEVVRIELELCNLVFDVHSILGEQAESTDGELGMSPDIQIPVRPDSDPEGQHTNHLLHDAPVHLDSHFDHFEFLPCIFSQRF